MAWIYAHSWLTGWPRLSRELHLRWSALQSQIRSNERADFSLAQRIREVMPGVLTAYLHANIDVTSHGLLLKPSTPAAPKTVLRGFRLVDGV